MQATRQNTWLMLTISILALMSGLIFVIRHIHGPSDGARLEPGQKNITSEGLILTPFEANSNSIQAGDLVIAVNGTEMETWAQSLLGTHEGSDWEIGQTLIYTVSRTGKNLELPVTLRQYPLKANLLKNWGLISFATAFLLIAGFIRIRKPNHHGGQILFLTACALAGSTAWSFGLQVSDFTDGTGFWLYKISTLLFYDLFWIGGLHFALIFPKPNPILLKSRFIIPAIYVIPYFLLGTFLILARSASSGILDWFSRWTVPEGIHATFFLSMTLLATIWQYRNSRSGITRHQIRWITFASLISGGSGLLLYVIPSVLGRQIIDINLAGLIVLPFPIAIAIAILRHNLFDIDKLINRTMVYGALSASTMTLYIFIVGYLSDKFQINDRTIITFFTTGLVAILFQPLRNWLQKSVNRWMYGERDEPYQVLVNLSEQMGKTLSPENTLPTLIETIARTLKLPCVTITLFHSGIEETQATFGLPKEPFIQLPLIHHSELIGYLKVSQRSHDEEFSLSEKHLLENIAAQASTAAFNVRLMHDLQRARLNLVTAREEERRRIRRDLHDGLGPNLASLTLRADTIHNLLEHDPQRADQMLGDLKRQIQSTIQDVRLLVYELRPPALDELGLIGAIESFIDKNATTQPEIILNAAKPFPDLSAALEVAVYRIAMEGLNNILRHAKAEHAIIEIRIQNKELIIDIQDDGIGMSPVSITGVGLASMREHAEELGGKFKVLPAQPGFHIRAEIPFLEERYNG